MVIGSFLAVAGLAASAAVPTQGTGVTLGSLVGKYQLLESGVAAGELDVRKWERTAGAFEVVFSFGHPDVMNRTILYLMPTSSAQRFRVVRSEADPALLDKDGEVKITDAGLQFTFYMTSRTGDRGEVLDTWQVKDGGDLTVSTALAAPGAATRRTVRVLTASKAR